MTCIVPKIDPDSPIPLYHQIAEAIRYAIATGQIRSGDSLPGLHQAAAEWGVNLHTVRHAYSELARQGLVTTRGPQGTIVLATPASLDLQRRNWNSLTEFLDRIADEAERLHAISAKELGSLLIGMRSRSLKSIDTVTVVECSETQAKDLAAQIATAWNVNALAWSLEWLEEPAHGLIIATYFHYNEILQRWPQRFPEMHFAAIQPDPAMPRKLFSRGMPHHRTTLFLCECDDSMASNIATELALLFPVERFSIERRITRSPASLLRSKSKIPVLFSPRMWGQLTPAQRSDSRAFEVRYVFVPDDLQMIAKRLGWKPRIE
jgi:GntR family transcriptional regulator